MFFSFFVPFEYNNTIVFIPPHPVVMCIEAQDNNQAYDIDQIHPGAKGRSQRTEFQWSDTIAHERGI